MPDPYKTWVVENLGSVVEGFIRLCLDFSISTNLCGTEISQSQYGWSILISVEYHQQCQLVLRTVLKDSSIDSSITFWKAISFVLNGQNHTRQNASEVSVAVCRDQFESFNLTQPYYKVSLLHIFLDLKLLIPSKLLSRDNYQRKLLIFLSVFKITQVQLGKISLFWLFSHWLSTTWGFMNYLSWQLCKFMQIYRSHLLCYIQMSRVSLFYFCVNCLLPYTCLVDALCDILQCNVKFNTHFCSC